MGPLEAAVVELSFDTLPRLFNPFFHRVQGYGLVSIFPNPIFVGAVSVFCQLGRRMASRSPFFISSVDAG